MKRSVNILVLLVVSFACTNAQKSRVLAVIQMIDQAKYTEARDAIELAIWNDKTSKWPRTFHAKGLLCQTAWEDGYPKKDAKKTAIYPDQLYLAYASFEKALELDASERLKGTISQKYYHLSNDFRKLGQDHFNRKEYKKALRAFEHALLVNNSVLIQEKPDTSLVFNVALAAHESGDWDKAIAYLTGLHDDAHAASTSLLLYTAHMGLGDTARSEEVLMEALNSYNYEDQIVVYMINHFVDSQRLHLALNVLEEALANQPENYHFYWIKGLIYTRMNDFDMAVESFEKALEASPEEAEICYHLGVIYYNQGIELRDASLEVKNNARYRRMKDEATEKFTEAVKWLEKSYELDPNDKKTVSRLYQLYYQLQMKEKEKSLQLRIKD